MIALGLVGMHLANIRNSGVLVAGVASIDVVAVPPTQGISDGGVDFGGFYLVVMVAPSTADGIDNEVDGRAHKSPLGYCPIG